MDGDGMRRCEPLCGASRGYAFPLDAPSGLLDDRHADRDDEPAAGRRTQRERAAHQLGALAHAHQPDAAIDLVRALGQAAAVVFDFELDASVALRQADAASSAPE